MIATMLLILSYITIYPYSSNYDVAINTTVNIDLSQANPSTCD